MTRPVKVAAVLLFAMIAGPADQAVACSCAGSGPPCAATWDADAVFAGRVRSIEEVNHDAWGAPYPSLLVRFDAEHAFVNAGPGPVEVMTARWGPACGYSFKVGTSYLVYAGKAASGRLVTGICSRTRPLDDAEEDLRYLRALPPAAAGARVFGRITQWERDPAESMAVDYGPLEGVVVNVRAGAVSVDARTDRHGRYEVAGLPIGPSVVTVLAPPEFRRDGLVREFELKDARGCSQHDFQLRHSARASGTIVDAAGRPVAGVAVDAVAAELAAHQPPPYQRRVTTDAQGQFAFDDLPPGTYVFGINLTREQSQRPQGPPVFLPGTTAAGDATLVELIPGDWKQIGVLRLPAR